MSFIEQELGNRLNAKEVASYLGVDKRLVIKHYRELGGVRLGERRYIFFEKRLVNAVTALSPEHSLEPTSPSQVVTGEESRRRPARSLSNHHNIFEATNKPSTDRGGRYDQIHS